MKEAIAWVYKDKIHRLSQDVPHLTEGFSWDLTGLGISGSAIIKEIFKNKIGL